MHKYDSSVAFSSRISKSESEIRIINSVYFAKNSWELELESWNPLQFENEERETYFQGGGGNESPIPKIDYFTLPKIKNVHIVFIYN